MTDNRTIELLPCPFCGGEADEYEGDYGNGIYCMMCGAMVGELIHLEYMTTRRVSIDEAIAAWNARAEQTCEFVECGICKFYHADIQLCEYGIPPCSKFERNELNARAERTCEFKPFRSDTNEEGERQGICSVCSAYMHEQFCFCPNCGAKVVDA